MKPPWTIRWRWLLPVTQVALAMLLLSVAEKQINSQIERYRAAHKGETFDWGYLVTIYPASSARVAFSANLPAFFLSNILCRVCHTNLLFFTFVFLLWFWIGSMIDAHGSAPKNARRKFRWLPRIAYVVGLLVAGSGIVLVLLTFAGRVRSPDSGYWSVAATLGWSVAFFVYLATAFRRELASTPAGCE